MSKRELWNEMADWLTDAFSFFERCLSNCKNFRVKVSGLVRLRSTVNLAFRDMYQIHWGLLTCLAMRDIYSGAYMSRNPRHIPTSHRITCLIPTCKNTCGRNNTKTTFSEIFFIGYHFITARKVSPAISSLNVCENVTGYIDISLLEV